MPDSGEVGKGTSSIVNSNNYDSTLLANYHQRRTSQAG